MTDKHPLTDEICNSIASPYYNPYGVDYDDLRAAADWQLEQDAEGWKIILNALEMIPPHVVDSIIEEFKQAMRPTSTQENS